MSKILKNVIVTTITYFLLTGLISFFYFAQETLINEFIASRIAPAVVSIVKENLRKAGYPIEISPESVKKLVALAESNPANNRESIQNIENRVERLASQMEKAEKRMKKAEKRMKKAGRQIDRAEKQMMKAGKEMMKAGNEMRTAGKQMRDGRAPMKKAGKFMGEAGRQMRK